MRVLVTGGAGFIGSHLVEALVADGAEPVVLDNFDPTYDPAIKRRNLVPGVELVEGDVRDAARVRALVARCDGVVHLAGRAGVRESMADPAAYASINVEGTATVLEAVGRAGGRPMVFASSSSVYGELDGPAHEELPAVAPVSPYAASKRAAELFCLASGLDVSVVRLFTVYGPRQRPGMAIARFAAAIAAGRPIELYGDGSTRRDYTFVADTVRGIRLALARAAGVRIVNLGGGHPVRLDELVAAIGAAVGREPRIKRISRQPGDVTETRADPSRAAAWLGWRPEVSLAEGLARHVAWLRLQSSDDPRPGGRVQ